MSVPYGVQQPIIQQPIAAQGMVVNPKNSLNKPNIDSGGREWSYGLCDCNNCGTFCLAYCLPCIVYGSNKGRLRYLERNGTPDPERGGVFNSDCVLYACLCGGGPILQINNREHIRGRYGIKGGVWSDCCTSTCCNPCALTQEEAEIELEEKAIPQPGNNK